MHKVMDIRKLSATLFVAIGCLISVSPALAQDWAGLQKFIAANAALEAPAAGQSRVVLMGDSITEIWPDRHPVFFDQTGYIGRGISGEETAQMLLRFRADVIDIGASTMVLLAGINDIAQNMGDPYVEDVTYANILSMVDLCWQNGIRPVICSVLPSYHLRWRPEVTDTYEKVLSLNARLKAYCERHGITYVDYGSVLAGPDGKIKADYSGDTVHPNAAGYELMEKLLLETLK